MAVLRICKVRHSNGGVRRGGAEEEQGEAKRRQREEKSSNGRAESGVAMEEQSTDENCNWQGETKHYKEWQRRRKEKVCVGIVQT